MTEVAALITKAKWDRVRADQAVALVIDTIPTLDGLDMDPSRVNPMSNRLFEVYGIHTFIESKK
jgi:RNA processing factor Prp31